jgi:hypothetical protein
MRAVSTFLLTFLHFLLDEFELSDPSCLFIAETDRTQYQTIPNGEVLSDQPSNPIISTENSAKYYQSIVDDAQG